MSWPANFETSVRRHLQYLSADEPLRPDRLLREVGLDSLATVQLLIDIENEFDVQLPDEDVTADTFQTAISLWDVLSRLLASAAPR